MEVMVFILLGLTAAYWLTPIILIISGIRKYKLKPKEAKEYFIIAGVMLIVGLGFCGSMFFG